VARVGGDVTALPVRDRATLFFHRGWQMGLDLTTRIEKLLTWLGLWGALRGFFPLAAAIALSVALLESLTSPVARLFPAVPATLIHVFAVGTGILLGLIGYFAGDSWDLLFETLYGPKGKWREAEYRPFLVLPPGATLTRHRRQVPHALPRKPEAGEEVYREAVKVARRQVERWERIERPLILSRCMRGLLWPSVFVTILGGGAAAVLLLLGAAPEAPRFLATAGICVALAAVFLVPYSALRVEHMIRLYQDVADHAPRKKSERR
jgi:hypothetical protein